jgi:hypothetical protein
MRQQEVLRTARTATCPAKVTTTADPTTWEVATGTMEEDSEVAAVEDLMVLVAEA